MKLDHLVAETAAAPFRVRAFRRAAVDVCTRQVVEDVEGRFLRAREGRPPDDIVAWVWRNGPLLPQLVKLARQWLAPDGCGMRLRSVFEEPGRSRQAGREILRWRAISLRMPASMLAAAATPANARPNPRVIVLDPTLRPAGPIAHQHVHVGAACEFPVLWAHLAARRKRIPVEPSNAPDGFEADEWSGWLARALVVRRLLVLLFRQPGLDLGEAARFAFGPDAIGHVRESVNDLCAGCMADCSRYLTTRLQRLASGPVRCPFVPQTLNHVWHRDPIADGGPWPEGRLLGLGFDQCASAPADPKCSARERARRRARLFTQYLRVKCMLFEHLVQDPTRPALRPFTKTFERSRSYGKGLERVRADMILDEPEIELRAVELRTSPPSKPSDVKTSACRLRRWGLSHNTEVAWIYHLIRSRGHALGYGHQYRALRRSVRALETALRLDPHLLEIVRAMDLASDESRGPLWLALPSLHSMRRLSETLAAQYGVPPLRLTLHVGEDFTHLATGLRSIHEPFVWNLMQRGDRLGHALALGIDSGDWIRRNPEVVVTRETRILDLAWLIDYVRTRPGCLGPQAGEVVEAWKGELSTHLADVRGPQSVDVEQAIRFHRQLGGPDWCDRAFSSLARPHAVDSIDHFFANEWSLAKSALLSASVVVRTEPEAAILCHISDSLAELLARWQTAIEVNPSSNLVIGDLPDPLAQPMFRLRPVSPTEGRALPITLNADDPLTFACRLSDEIAYAWAGMVVAGNIAPSYAQSWLEDAARTSWRTRFTLPIPFAE